MSFDDFFDDLDWQDMVVGLGFLDYMTEEERRDEKLRRLLERDLPEDYDPIFNPDDEEPYP
jgi:hypothetical protein